MIRIDLIREECKKKGISVTKLEQELGISNGLLTKSKNLSSDRLYSLSSYFGRSMEYFITGEDKTPQKGVFSEEEEELIAALRESPEHVQEGIKMILDMKNAHRMPNR